MFYKLVVNGSIDGQDVKNIFYYRTGIGFDIGGLTLGGAQELAQEFRDEVWTGAWRQAVSYGYMLEDITVYPINDSFQLAYSLPYVLPVNERGADAGENLGAASCVNVKFNLESQPIGQNFFAPKRGYVAIAGICESHQHDGRLVDDWFNNAAQGFKLLADKLAQNIESVLPPVIFFPVRVRLVDNPLSDSPLFLGWADVGGAVVDRVLSFRRSRKPQ